jgi:fatty acid desaturase
MVRWRGSDTKLKVMTMRQPSEDPDVAVSVRRVRRGCVMMAIIVIAMTIFLISATGNLAFSLLLLVAIALLAIAFVVVREGT